MSTYIGVDGGGTKTHILVMHQDKLAAITTSASNPQTVGMRTAKEVISCGIESCLHALQLHSSNATGLSLCMSGVDRRDESDEIKAFFESRFPHAVVEVKNDALAALTAGTKGEPGVVLIAGTGSIAIGESEFGETVRAGGYGYLLGDEGSGFRIGQRGLMAAIQSFEGRAPTTALWERAADVYQVATSGELIPLIYRADRPINKVAEFAQEVVALASADDVANQIVTASILDYVQLVHSVFRLLPDNTPKTVVLSGGLFTNTDVLVHRLQKAEPGIQFVPLIDSPASGAVLRAIKQVYLASGKRQEEATNLWQANLERMKRRPRRTSSENVFTY